MFDRLTLPSYSEVKHFEGKGDFAVKKYYSLPFRWFYRHKLKMIVGMMEPKKIYRNILDFGCGAPRIFTEELMKHALAVKSVDYKEEIDSRSRFDVIVCASVLEFVDLTSTLPFLKKVTSPKGMIIVASPAKNWITKIYFWIIGNKSKRHSESEIVYELHKYYRVTKHKRWFGLYFCAKGFSR